MSETMSKAAEDVLAERARQISAEGWTPAHDDRHGDGELAMAATYYAAFGAVSDELRANSADPPPPRQDAEEFGWPWSVEWWKPTTRRRDLVKAAALIIAEIERLDRKGAQ